MSEKIFAPKKSLGQENILDPKENLCPKNFVSESFGSKRILCPNNFGIKKFDSKNEGNISCLTQTFLEPNIWDPKNFGIDKIWLKKIWDQKKSLGPKKYWVQKSLGQTIC